MNKEKYCPIIGARTVCWNCTLADENENCLVVKALIQYTNPLSSLAQRYSTPVDMNILHGQTVYTTRLEQEKND